MEIREKKENGEICAAEAECREVRPVETQHVKMKLNQTNEQAGKKDAHNFARYR